MKVLIKVHLEYEKRYFNLVLMKSAENPYILTTYICFNCILFSQRERRLLISYYGYRFFKDKLVCVMV